MLSMPALAAPTCTWNAWGMSAMPAEMKRIVPLVSLRLGEGRALSWRRGREGAFEGVKVWKEHLRDLQRLRR
jgi:hypothetical protein